MMRFLKRLPLFLIVLLLFSLSACNLGQTAPEAITPTPSETPPAQTQPVKTAAPTQTPQESPQTPPPTPEPPATFSMCVLGDVLVHNTQLTDAYSSADGTYDFTHCFRYIKDYVSQADIAFAQLETTFGGGPDYAGYPSFNTPDEMAFALADAGVDMMGLAGNHVLDRGYSGLIRTRDVVLSAGMTPIGSYATQEERDENGGVLLKEINGIRVAFLAYTYGTNGIPLPSGKEYVTNLLYTDYLTNLSVLNKEQILTDLDAAKALDPDLIVTIAHWGNEYATKQNKYQEEAALFFFENGVDVILGSHSHVLQPFEKRTVTTVDGQVKDVFVSFCLGNLISAQNKDYTNLSAMLNLSFQMDPATRDVTLTDITYVPIYTVKGTTESSNYHVLPINEGILEYESEEESAISGSLYSSLVKGLEDIHSILGPQSDIGLKAP